MEILILGDSLPFGRPKYGISRDLTWPYLMSAELGCNLQIRARGGSSVVNVLNEAQTLNKYWFEGLQARKFDAAFIQVGIVDCCPRLLPQRLYGLARCFPWFRKLERCPVAHKLVGRPWTPRNVFFDRLSTLSWLLPKISKSSFFVEIANPVNHLVENVGDFSDAVDDYNLIIQRSTSSHTFVKWLDSDRSCEFYFLPDGHHLSANGHRAVVKACLNRYQAAL